MIRYPVCTCGHSALRHSNGGEYGADLQRCHDCDCADLRNAVLPDPFDLTDA